VERALLIGAPLTAEVAKKLGTPEQEETSPVSSLLNLKAAPRFTVKVLIPAAKSIVRVDDASLLRA
jgi:hypothetical protein